MDHTPLPGAVLITQPDCPVPGLSLDSRATTGSRLGPVVTSRLLPDTGQWARGRAEVQRAEPPPPRPSLPRPGLPSPRECVPVPGTHVLPPDWKPSVSPLSFRRVRRVHVCDLRVLHGLEKLVAFEIEGVPTDLVPPFPR